MKHSFVSSAGNQELCRCGRPEIDHTDRATCEACGNSGTCDVMAGNILACMDCQEKEARLQAENNTPEKQQARVDQMNSVLQIARAIDTTVQVRTDVFNAETLAIVDIKRAIDEDETIQNKHFTLSKIIDERFVQFGEAIFAKREEIAILEAKQRASQNYYHELKKKLTAEERASLKLKDVTYQPAEPKTVKPKAPSQSINKIELDKLCKQYGIEQYKHIVNIIVMQKKVSIEEAVKHVKKTMG